MNKKLDDFNVFYLHVMLPVFHRIPEDRNADGGEFSKFGNVLLDLTLRVDSCDNARFCIEEFSISQVNRETCECHFSIFCLSGLFRSRIGSIPNLRKPSAPRLPD